MPSATSEVHYLHHLPRYVLLQDYLPGATVLHLEADASSPGPQLIADMGAKYVVGLTSGPTGAGRAGMPGVLEEGVTFLTADYRQLPFEDQTFDVIFAFEALTTATDLPQTLRELKRVLSSEGVLVAAVPNFAHDDVREVLGEGERRSPYRAPVELYDALARTFGHVSVLTQSPFLGYVLLEHTSQEGPRKPFNLSYDLLKGRAEPTLFYTFLVSDLEIILEEDRLIQIPFSYFADRLQEGLRLLYRSLERKNSALLEQRQELVTLRRDGTRQGEHLLKLRSQLHRVVGRLEIIAAGLDPLLADAGTVQELREGLKRLHERLANLLDTIDLDHLEEPADMVPAPAGAPARGLPQMSQEEARLLTEGLMGAPIGDQLRKIEEAPPATLKIPPAQPVARSAPPPDLPSDPLLQDDLAPFRLPGPVPLSTTLRQELAETRERLNQREAEIRHIEAWREGLLDQARALEVHLRRGLERETTTRQLRRTALDGWHALIQLLRDEELDAELAAALERVILEEDEAEEAAELPEQSAWEEGGAPGAGDREAIAGELPRLEAPTGEPFEEMLEARLGTPEAGENAVQAPETPLAIGEAPLEVLEAPLPAGEELVEAPEEPLAVGEEALETPVEALEAPIEALEAPEAELAEEAGTPSGEALPELEPVRAAAYERVSGVALEVAEAREVRAALESELSIREKALADGEWALADRMAAAAAREAALVRTDQELREREAALEARAQALTILELQLTTRKLALQTHEDERDALLAARDIQLGELELRLQHAEERARVAQRDREQLNRQLDHAMMGREEVSGTIAFLETELASARGAAAAAEAQVAELQTRLHQVQQAHATQTSALKAEQEETRAQLANRRSEVEALTRRATFAANLEASVADLRVQLSTQERTARKAQESSGQAEARRQELEQRVADRDRVVAELERKVAELRDEVQQARQGAAARVAGAAPGADLVGLQTDQVARGTDVVAGDASQALLREQSERLERLQKDLDARDVLLTRVQKELDLKSTHNRNLQEIIGKQREDLDKIKGKIREAIEYIGRLHQANQEKDQELEDLRKQLHRPGDSSLQA